MNVQLRIVRSTDAAQIAHSILAYGSASEELELEVPVPLFLDTLALKVAGVPAEDKFGALSYPLGSKAVETFRFLLGLDVNTESRDYFLESTVSYVTTLSPATLEAVEVMS